MSRKYQFGSPQKFTPTEEENSTNPWLKLGEMQIIFALLEQSSFWIFNRVLGNQQTYTKLRLPRAGDHGIYEFVDPNSEVSVLHRTVAYYLFYKNLVAYATSNV